MKKISTVSLSCNKPDEKVLSIAEQCIEILLSQSIKVLIDKSLSKVKLSKVPIVSPHKIIKESDLVIAIGGDGTMINCSRKFGVEGIPILGINLGNLGFLNDIDPKDLTESILGVIAGDYIEDERLFLKASFKDQKTKLTSDIALNEAVIHSGEIAKLIEYDLLINDTFVYRQRSDGLIISTPTGSTGYSLSGGGPIIHPKVDCFILLPMLPLSLSSSPLIIDINSIIKVRLIGEKKNAYLSLDSQTSFLLKGEKEIQISKSGNKLNLIHPSGHNFFKACRNKLGWSSAYLNS